MSSATIQTQSNTATETRSLASELESQPFEPGESAGRLIDLWPGRAVAFSPGRIYPTTLLGVEALIQHQRQQRALESGTVVVLELDLETEVTQLFGDWWRGISASVLGHGLSHAARVSRPCFSSCSVGWSTGAAFPCQEGTESSDHEPEMVDWHVRIETPPPRRSERVVAAFAGDPCRPARRTPVSPEDADQPEEKVPTLYERLKRVIGAAKGLPEDLAKNHDHYLHGQPKK